MNTTRRQHYVWKHYLRAWERNGRVCVLRKKTAETFEADPANVAVMRDFYRIPQLSEEDESFIQYLIESTSTPKMLKELNEGWLNSTAAISRLRRDLTKSGGIPPSIEKEFERLEIQSDENRLSRIEGNAIRLIDALQSGQVDIWSDINDAHDLAYFLSVQHLRTKRMRDVIMEGYPEGPERETIARTWPVCRHIFATNMGWSIFSERGDWRLRVLRASGSTRFITGDQPTLNLIPAKRRNDLALYYPVSPISAAILEHRENKSVVGMDDNLAEEVIESLNRRIYDFSHEQVIGESSAYLKRLSH